MAENQKLKVKVFRFNPTKDTNPYYEEYEVPYIEGMRVLDVLNYIHDNYDGSLAYRWECRAGQCGSCAIMINKKAGLACQTLVDPKAEELLLEPLPIFPVIRDLVVDVQKGYKKLLKIRPYIHRDSVSKHPEIIYQYEIEDLKPMRECIECWSCIAMCPVIQSAWDIYGGPMVMVHLAKLSLDKRNAFDHLLMAFLEGLYACTQCANCKEVCPKEIDIPEKAVGKMRYLAYNKRSLIRNEHQRIVESVKRFYNPLNEDNASRAEWAKDLDIPVAKRGAKLLYFVGCMASWREQRVARATVMLLKLAGTDFTILGPYERDCGSVFVRLGDMELVKEFALYMKNIVKDYAFDAIVTSCAGCFRTFKVDYLEKLGIDLGVPIYHSSELFSQYIDEGKLVPNVELDIPATYHDPCHLGRHVGVFEEPRKIIKAIGLNFKEMLNERYRENSRCCGAGGGVRSGYREVAREVAAYRVENDVPKEAQVIVQTCPFCYFNFEDAVRTNNYPVRNIDLTELLMVSVAGEKAVKVLGKERYDEILSLSRG
ncbi:MAG: fumarate reductase (CoM/CoB) subunit TfrB [Candidatus Baldrarchaeia archaeon]